MNNENLDPSRNIIILRSVWGKVGMKYFIQPSKNPKTGRYADCVRRVDSNGDMILSDADRIAVFEYHNGGKTITGVDFKKCSNTYEAVGKRIEEKHQEYQNIPISVNFLWNKLLSLLFLG